MTYWNIDSADGNGITEGIQLENEARKAAQRMANERGESVFLYEVGSGNSTEVAPDAGRRCVRGRNSDGSGWVLSVGDRVEYCWESDADERFGVIKGFGADGASAMVLWDDQSVTLDQVDVARLVTA